jgi:hypothetical protein
VETTEKKGVLYNAIDGKIEIYLMILREISIWYNAT